MCFEYCSFLQVFFFDQLQTTPSSLIGVFERSETTPWISCVGVLIKVRRLAIDEFKKLLRKL